ncbi:hypothetical protein Cgig2_023711 [Carnegiea gigantea]|uniref:Uncharacterized protein n=1 Tax=Carnegiea gigantea TaxID=171969 RepID=A0A9Q1KKU5_9CARY|nr:hypothetical protein Cgig2_023711 [Carnegiea gigantea]
MNHTSLNCPIMVWNAQGVTSREFFYTLKELMRKYEPKILVLSVTIMLMTFVAKSSLMDNLESILSALAVGCRFSENVEEAKTQFMTLNVSMELTMTEESHRSIQYNNAGFKNPKILLLRRNDYYIGSSHFTLDLPMDMHQKLDRLPKESPFLHNLKLRVPEDEECQFRHQIETTTNDDYEISLKN